MTKMDVEVQFYYTTFRRDFPANLTSVASIKTNQGGNNEEKIEESRFVHSFKEGDREDQST